MSTPIVLRTALSLGLRALADQLEAGDIELAELLERAPAPQPTASKAEPRPPQATPAPKRKKKTKAEKRPKTKANSQPPADTEVAKLVEQLVEMNGSLAIVSERFGFLPPTLGRWRAGQPCSPATLERLRQAVSAGRPGRHPEQRDFPGAGQVA